MFQRLKNSCKLAETVPSPSKSAAAWPQILYFYSSQLHALYLTSHQTSTMPDKLRKNENEPLHSLNSNSEQKCFVLPGTSENKRGAARNIKQRIVTLASPRLHQATLAKQLCHSLPVQEGKHHLTNSLISFLVISLWFRKLPVEYCSC